MAGKDGRVGISAIGSTLKKDMAKLQQAPLWREQEMPHEVDPCTAHQRRRISLPFQSSIPRINVEAVPKWEGHFLRTTLSVVLSQQRIERNYHRFAQSHSSCTEVYEHHEWSKPRGQCYAE